MFLNYLKVSIRNLLDKKLLSGITIFGLAAGIACCLLISLYVLHETSYDKFHKNAPRIVRATMEVAYNGSPLNIAVTGTKVLPEFKRTFPEVEDGVRMYPVSTVVKHEGKIFQEKRFVYADSSFFKVFSFQLIKGDPAMVLNRPDQVVLSESTAAKYFGDEEPLGKTITINNKTEMVVTGIVKDCPENSQIKFDVVASWVSLTDPVYTEESYMDASHYTYLLLAKPELHAQLESRVQEHFRALSKKDGGDGKNYLTIHVQPLEDVHLRPVTEGGFEPGGDYRYVYLFSIVSVLILIVACANYTNFVTARASERAREIGVRKVIGASRKQLIIQFLGESSLTVLISIVAGLAITQVCLPVIQLITGKNLVLIDMITTDRIFIFSAIILFICIVSSVYPAFFLSGFNPLKTLKGKAINAPSAQGAWLRQTLIVVQFVISVSLIVATLVIKNQLSFIQNKKLGFKKDNILVLRTDEELRSKLSTLKSMYSDDSDVLGITTCSQTPVFIPGKYNIKVDDKEQLISAVRIDKDFIRTLDLVLISGTDFSIEEERQAFAMTDTADRPLILNEAAVLHFGWNNENAIGQKVRFQGRPGTVKGVIEDFHFSSLHESIKPCVLFVGGFTTRLLVKISGNNMSETLSRLKKDWASLAPNLPFEYEFLDDQFNNLYKSEMQMSKLFFAFAFLSIGLACLGLLGLVTFMTRERTKEIGIRKVLGATVTSIVGLLSKDFFRLIVLAFLIALPLSWWALDKWLENFTYRTSIDAWMLLTGCLITLVIAFFTISFQTIRAALDNPAESLKNE